MPKKKPVASRKGFPIRLQRPRWHLLLAAMTYQAEIGRAKDRQALLQLRKFFADAIDFPMGEGGHKTIRVRARDVPVMQRALKFATRLHQANAFNKLTYPSSAGKEFLGVVEGLKQLTAVDLLADTGR